MKAKRGTHSRPLLERYKYLMFLLVGAVTLAGIVMLFFNRPAPVSITVLPPEPTLPPTATAIPSATPTPGPYTVYVTGAVATPDLIMTLDFGSRVFQAIEAAGGALPQADLARVNLAQILADGDQVHVPTQPSAAAGVAPVATIIIVTPTPGSYTVYVTGEVTHAGQLISVPSGSRVQDAIAAAGGATGNADLRRVNLGQILNDGDLVYVPPLVGDPIQTPTPNQAPLVHINYATPEELETLPGIGPSLAQAIIDYRAENGPFLSLDDLDNVSGIGPGKLDDIRDRVVLD